MVFEGDVGVFEPDIDISPAAIKAAQEATGLPLQADRPPALPARQIVAEALAELVRMSAFPGQAIFDRRSLVQAILDNAPRMEDLGEAAWALVNLTRFVPLGDEKGHAAIADLWGRLVGRIANDEARQIEIDQARFHALEGCALSARAEDRCLEELNAMKPGPAAKALSRLIDGGSLDRGKILRYIGLRVRDLSDQPGDYWPVGHLVNRWVRHERPWRSADEITDELRGLERRVPGIRAYVNYETRGFFPPSEAPNRGSLAVLQA